MSGGCPRRRLNPLCGCTTSRFGNLHSPCYTVTVRSLVLPQLGRGRKGPELPTGSNCEDSLLVKKTTQPLLQRGPESPRPTRS
ncbi:hypothetical protein Y1Q_0008131 [Alligator mississippiensis]|uniref:Uncharacterized protein n=1 Tax=Alligator mississippiensis TaxID=8496 RepID=A0A151N697_ALLMI|nr:hypothetical protein Y1Q_0008131 [Alligator mississippiensis]